MRAITSEHAMRQKVNGGAGWERRSPWRQVFRGFWFSMFLFLVTSVSGTLNGISGESAALTNSPSKSEEGKFEPSFCLEGDVMMQLLQAFGSKRLLDEISGYQLNCAARILKEDLVGNQAILDVELDCECVSPDSGNVEPMHVKGEWNLSFDL